MLYTYFANKNNKFLRQRSPTLQGKSGQTKIVPWLFCNKEKEVSLHAHLYSFQSIAFLYSFKAEMFHTILGRGYWDPCLTEPSSTTSTLGSTSFITCKQSFKEKDNEAI